jgi:predicted ribosomally synthesized peptide with SipW-like signal peptide
MRRREAPALRARMDGSWGRRLRALLAIGPLVALSCAGAYAAFTDTVDATSSFSTGSVSIVIGLLYLCSAP